MKSVIVALVVVGASIILGGCAMDPHPYDAGLAGRSLPPMAAYGSAAPLTMSTKPSAPARTSIHPWCPDRGEGYHGPYQCGQGQ